MSMLNSLRQILTISKYTVKECLQQPICILLTLTSVLLTTLQPMMQMFTIGDSERLVRDGAFAYLLVFGLIIICFTAGFTLSKELKSGTASVSFIKPISKEIFLLGKYLGVITLLIIFCVISSFATLFAIRATEHYVENAQLVGYYRDKYSSILGLVVPFLSLILAGLFNRFKNYRLGLSFFVSMLVLYLITFLILGLFSPEMIYLGFSKYKLDFNFSVLKIILLEYFLLSIYASISISLTTFLSSGKTLGICFIVLLLGFFIDSAMLHSQLCGMIMMTFIPDVQSFWLVDMLNNFSFSWGKYILHVFLYSMSLQMLYLFLGMLKINNEDMI